MFLVKRLGPSSGDKRYINAIAIAKLSSYSSFKE